MLAAFYTRLGPAADVLQVGELPSQMPGPGEVRVRLQSSGVNPSDWKSRIGARGDAMSWPLIIPHSDGGGQIDELTALLLAGSLKHTIAYCLPLERIADAHILGEQGTALGSIVLIPPS
jgi:NADPH:quinone reductase-like Zn-dependent oxidoreductase